MTTTYSDLPDEKNPDYMFQTTHMDLLARAVRGEIDLLALATAELAARGLDPKTGRWVGFKRALRTS